MREVKTCGRCRHFKRRCDLLKPACSRCIQASTHCNYNSDEGGSADSFSSVDTPSTATTTSFSFVPINAAPISAVPANAVPSGAISVLANPVGGPAFVPSITATSPPTNDDISSNPTNHHGLISPSTSTESPEPQPSTVDNVPAPEESTASVEPPAPAQRIIRKRKRNCLSCLRCHRLKVKCDKELPCGRCKSSGNGRECYYTYNKGPNGGKFPCPSAPTSNKVEETKTVLATWQVQHKVRGSSHWRDLMTKIGALTQMKSHSLAAALEDVATNACLANFTLPGNFPFGTPGASKYYTRDAVTRLLATEKANVGKYIQGYVELLDVVNPILDFDIFEREVERYWVDPHAVNLCWLSQFLMVLGLGCFVACNESPVAVELMMGAEACLMQTPWSFRPTLLSLKTMALMVVAKQVCNATCWSVDSCWSFLGMLVRTAFIYGLPQDTSTGGDPTQSAEENDARKKLWLTILYLDIKVAMCTGMPPLTRPDELGSLKKIPDWGASDSLQMVLYQSLPTVLTVMSQINSKKDQIAYPDVLRYNTQIRELMAHAERICPNELQRMTVDIFLRRCLMVLHRPFALHQEGPIMFPESYWSSLECCIKLLMNYREMWSGESDKRLDLLGRAYVLDFFSGSLTTYIHVLREDAPLAGAESMGCIIPPKQLILELLRDCVEIWSPEKDKSVCYRTGYNLLEAVLNLLPKNLANE
ncbi:hypothetical protein PT974_07331 [Cladobotryum mycophilum]|uniref:Zn(2)-C6 fungal-type domain-containing protein n=1 Tax=Cladobotryum mycophilum TaxID=491253 RepID=A0ABR0SNZ3_9HYPO